MEFTTRELKSFAGATKGQTIINSFYKANIPYDQRMIRLSNGSMSLVNFYKFDDAESFLQTESLNPKTNTARMRNLKVIRGLKNAKRNEIQTLEA